MIASSSTTTLASPAATTAVAAATRRATVARAVPRALAAAGSLGSRSRAAIAGASANRAVVVRLARGVRATRPLPSSSPRRAGRVAVAPRAAASNPFAADASGGVFSRPPRSVVESESVAKSIREPVENAIESLGLAVTVGDVAAAAGVKLSDAERAMTALAADTGAALEVSSEGDLLYVFDAGFRSKVRSIQKFFTHRPVSTFDRAPFQLTGELFLYGMALSSRPSRCASAPSPRWRRLGRWAPTSRA